MALVTVFHPQASVSPSVKWGQASAPTITREAVRTVLRDPRDRTALWREGPWPSGEHEGGLAAQSGERKEDGGPRAYEEQKGDPERAGMTTKGDGEEKTETETGQVRTENAGTCTRVRRPQTAEAVPTLS